MIFKKDNDNNKKSEKDFFLDNFSRNKGYKRYEANPDMLPVRYQIIIGVIVAVGIILAMAIIAGTIDNIKMKQYSKIAENITNTDCRYKNLDNDGNMEIICIVPKERINDISKNDT